MDHEEDINSKLVLKVTIVIKYSSKAWNIRSKIWATPKLHNSTNWAPNRMWLAVARLTWLVIQRVIKGVILQSAQREIRITIWYSIFKIQIKCNRTWLRNLLSQAKTFLALRRTWQSNFSIRIKSWVKK